MKGMLERGNIMRMTNIAPMILLTFVLATPVHAQSTAPNTVNVDRLPIDVGRIQRELRQSAERSENEGLRLRYFVDVYGQAPPLVIFGPQDNLVDGPVPYGAPTHREMVEHVTPIDYRPMAWDLNSLYRWLAERAKKK
jgi:hypothetical protein